MRLKRVATTDGPRWRYSDADTTVQLPSGAGLADALEPGRLSELVARSTAAPGRCLRTLAPVDPDTEVWAAGVTYARSLEARVAESNTPDIYDRVYAAERPELFPKSVGWRVSGPGQPISVRADSEWNVPEPELAVVLNASGAVFGWTICNDVSSRSIEAANPLYLPQAKVYLGSCALGPAIVLAGAVPEPYALTIDLQIERHGATAWSGRTSTGLLRRRVPELAEALFRADVFPSGVVLATGTSLVPGDEFTLSAGDVVRISIEGVGELVNPTVRGLVPDAEERSTARAAWSRR